MDADATQNSVAGPGHWNDPDYLAPDQGMTSTQFQTQMSMWAILAAPFMFSDNMLTLSSSSYGALRNKQVIAVDQDPAGIQGWLVAGSVSGNGEAWTKPLSDGSYAVALVNRGSTAQTVATTTPAVGLPAAPSYSEVNLWTGARSTTTSALSAMVAPYATVLLKVQGPKVQGPKAGAKTKGRKVRGPKAKGPFLTPAAR
jgi:alpha-galactosidase